MKAILYLLGGALTVPGILLAYFIWTVTQAIRQESFWKFLFYLLVQAVRMMEWGFFLIIAAVAVWLTLAFVPKYRWLGALAMAVAAVLSLIEMFAGAGAPKSAGDLWFPIMSFTGLALNLWLVWDGVSPSIAAK